MIKTFTEFINENIGSSKDLVKNKIYHWKQENSYGDDISGDWKFIEYDGHNLVFELVKSYSSKDTITKYHKKWNMKDFGQIGSITRTDYPAIQRAIKGGDFYEVEN